MYAVNMDLKAFSDKSYKEIWEARFEPELAPIRLIKDLLARGLRSLRLL